MSKGSGVGKPPRLLTEAEVADRLRCEPAKVKRIRLNGKIPYLPGRPPLIEEADLDAFILRERTAVPLKAHAPPAEAETSVRIKARAITAFLRRNPGLSDEQIRQIFSDL